MSAPPLSPPPPPLHPPSFSPLLLPSSSPRSSSLLLSPPYSFIPRLPSPLINSPPMLHLAAAHGCGGLRQLSEPPPQQGPLLGNGPVFNTFLIFPGHLLSFFALLIKHFIRSQRDAHAHEPQEAPSRLIRQPTPRFALRFLSLESPRHPKPPLVTLGVHSPHWSLLVYTHPIGHSWCTLTPLVTLGVHSPHWSLLVYIHPIGHSWCTLTPLVTLGLTSLATLGIHSPHGSLLVYTHPSGHYVPHFSGGHLLRRKGRKKLTHMHACIICTCGLQTPPRTLSLTSLNSHRPPTDHACRKLLCDRHNTDREREPSGPAKDNRTIFVGFGGFFPGPGILGFMWRLGFRVSCGGLGWVCCPLVAGPV